MIVFDLCCAAGHRFEGWFASSADFVSQGESGLLTCPECGSPDVAKAPMAPSVPAKGNRRSEVAPSANSVRPVSNAEMEPEVVKAMKALAKAQAKALKDSTWVGDKFAEKSRAMHYGEADSATIHGQATLKEAKELADEGIAVAPLPFPIAPPEDLN
ncbi:DUF1178 family protein [Allopontixanthobacter sp.]|uniref:DUF1178 family protein n=1 Tax=Allopontixanthobacter sp. TaxID=2906452 RepID=UPI002AB8BC2B|nr:DUF1178 family protein [Allopontixanthobacter sp.]MDZ4306445.1 DUF1178 family protein [Allopontixanthobacter sp.]